MQECKGVVICWQKSLKVIIRMETLVTVSLETKKSAWDFQIFGIGTSSNQFQPVRPLILPRWLVFGLLDTRFLLLSEG